MRPGTLVGFGCIFLGATFLWAFVAPTSTDAYAGRDNKKSDLIIMRFLGQEYELESPRTYTIKTVRVCPERAIKNNLPRPVAGTVEIVEVYKHLGTYSLKRTLYSYKKREKPRWQR